MKPFTKRIALVMGLLFTALICMGIVYIDTTQNFWRVGGAGNGFVQLIVSNKLVMSVSTNTGRIGINVTNADTFSVDVAGIQPSTNATGNGTTATTTGALNMTGAKGGGTFATTTASGGVGGRVFMTGGSGGDVPLATTNATGGAGGAFVFAAGTGGMEAIVGVATNATTGGAGGAANLSGGTGASPATPSTNTVGGAGGNAGLAGGAGGLPTAGWARLGGAGGAANLTGGAGGTGTTRTNGGAGGAVNITGGAGGGVSTAPGTAGAPGAVVIAAGNAGSASGAANTVPGADVSITAGNGSTGNTNSNAGHVFIAGGAPGSGAVPGNVVLARTSAGTSRGAGVQIGPFITGGTATLTNMLGGAATLDFPSTAAGTVSDLVIAVSGVTSNNFATSLSVPWQVLTANGGLFTTYNSNDAVYVRFVNNNLVTAIDPTPGDFAVIGFRIR